MKKIFLLFAISVIISACSSISEIKTPLPYHFTLVPGQRIRIPIDDNTEYRSYMISVFNRYLVYESRMKNAIQFYDLEKGELAFETLIQKRGDHRVGSVIGFLVRSLDSIYVIGSHREEITLIDTSGLVKYRYKAKRAENGETFGTIIGATKFPITKLGRKLYFPCLPDYNLSYETTVGQEMEIEYDLEKEQLSFNFHYPKTYKGFQNRHLFTFSRTVDKEANFYYSFSVGPEIYIKRSDGSLDTVINKSDYAKPEIIPPKYGQGSEEDLAFFIENNAYLDLVFDKYRNVFYRFFHLPVNYKNKQTGEKKDRDDKPFSIMILDADLQKTGEVLFDDFKHLPSDYFLTEEGLWLSDNHIKNPDLDEDYLSFTLYKLVQIQGDN